MAVTGCVLFSAEASHLVLNPAFQLKVVLVAAGLINVAIYELWAKRAVERLAPGASMPARAKVPGGLSLGIWVSVAAWRPSIAYCERSGAGARDQGTGPERINSASLHLIPSHRP